MAAAAVEDASIVDIKPSHGRRRRRHGGEWWGGRREPSEPRGATRRTPWNVTTAEQPTGYGKWNGEETTRPLGSFSETQGTLMMNREI